MLLSAGPTLPQAWLAAARQGKSRMSAHRLRHAVKAPPLEQSAQAPTQAWLPCSCKTGCQAGQEQGAIAPLQASV
eukprot:1150935-Pelagomonas_calceolata.AAC.20